MCSVSATPMQVRGTGVYRGPHLYSATPMVRIEMDLGALEDWPTNRLQGFTDRLMQALPGLHEHGCCFGEPGGFLRRLRDGTWLGHVAEHVALELQSKAGTPVTRGKTRSVRGQRGVYNVMFAFGYEEAGRMAGRFALEIVDGLLPANLRGITGLSRLDDTPAPRSADGSVDVEAAIQDLSRLIGRVGFGPTTRALVDEARRRDIPVMRLDANSFVQLGYGAAQKRIRASVTGESSSLAVEAASDKSLTKALLDDAGVPVPQGAVVRSVTDALAAAGNLGWPVVVKPLDGNHGRGVTLDIDSAEKLEAAFEEARSHSRRVIVEQQFRGRDYRVLVVGGEVCAVAERVPAHVTGDGRSTIAQLVEAENRDLRRGEGHVKVMTKIVIDDHVRARLELAGLTPDSVPRAGEQVFLRGTANLSTGGTAIDRTLEIHPENAWLAARAAQVIGLDVAGIDMTLPDITRSARETGGGVIEVNASPGFRMHLEPSEGQPRNVARPVIDRLFPDGSNGRIPVLAVTGTNGKSTTVRMLAHIYRSLGKTVGFTTTSGIQVGDHLIAEVDASGPQSARKVLRDPTVEVAVLETARGGMLREGLGFDWCDVGAVLNVQEDHIGLKGIDSIEDLARVKSIVTESVHRSGASILNADDPLTVAMRRHAGGRIVFFSLKGGEEMPGFLREHVAQGDMAVVREGGMLVLHRHGETRRLMRVGEIPATLDGLAEFNVQNAMAAAAMAIAQGVEPEAVARALSSFTTSYEQSPGRLNIHDAHGFRVILDYAHNPAGLAALGRVVAGLRARHPRAIGMVSIPGDRRDEDMHLMGRIAAGLFDEIVFREDPARRGRGQGEIVGLLAEGARAAGFPAERMHCVLDEEEAADTCLRLARPGDLVVLTPTEVEQMWRQVLDWQPEPRRPKVEPVLRLPTLDGEVELIAPAGTDPDLLRPRMGAGWALPPFPEPEGAEIGANGLLRKVQP
ncbi:cyanophycin synthetase [Paracoccus niistensis]|uniref:Cyanophycin synthetase n=2 Tax=Paracoccus niistensis TaxID=632935 RepID=A0ABV6I510_9RHOB